MATCYEWMGPFAEVVRRRGEVFLKVFPDIPNDDLHNIQTQLDLKLLESAQKLQELYEKRKSPVLVQSALEDLFPTPPNSDERHPLNSKLEKTPV